MVRKNNNKTVVILPTYNAKATIVELIKEILRFIKDTKVIVVDDNSPDKTSKIVKKYFARDKKVKLIIRDKKGGRGSAVIESFKEGLKDRNVKFFIEMDADFAHNPKDLPALLKETRNYDVVVASRYLLKSQILKWKFKRRIISKLANLWIKLILGITLTDNTNGFRCYRRKVIESINFSLIKSKGFIVLTEIAYQIYKKGFKFGELPIDFIPVDLNKSNLNLKEIKEAFFAVLRLKLNDLRFW